MPSTLTTEDRLQIQDLVSAYAWALDTGDVQGFVDCFASNGALIWDAFEEPDRWDGSEALRAFATGIQSRPESAGRQHHVSNLRVVGSDAGAQGSCYVTVTLREADGTVRTHVAGYYEDTYCLEEGRWHIATRTIRDWSGTVLGKFAGQTGARVARQRPAALAALRAGIAPKK
jgi:SnoaL-like domain